MMKCRINYNGEIFDKHIKNIPISMRGGKSVVNKVDHIGIAVSNLR